MISLHQAITGVFPRKGRVFGLDVGSFSIKLAEFARSERGLVLQRLKLKELDLQKTLQLAQLDALKDLFKGIDTKDAQINVVINCPQSCVRILVIPYMPETEIAQALKWEIKNFISFSVEEAMLDYEVLGEIAEGGVKKLKVACACLPQKTIDRYLDLLQEAGLQPALFTHPAFALKNIIDHLVPEKNKTVAILDIGKGCSELFIFNGRELDFCRKLPVAGQNFTQELSQALLSDLGRIQLTAAEAEEIKKRYGIPDAATGELLEGKLTCAQLLSLLRPNMEKLVTEIERSFDFYREKARGQTIERLILLGGASQLKGLAKNLTQQLNIPVEFGNPLRGMPLKEPALLKEMQDAAHRFVQAQAAALSLQAGLNLLPVEIKERTLLLVRRSFLKALVAAVIGILILTYMGMRLRLGVYDKRIAAAKLEVSVFAQQAPQLKEQAFLATTLSGYIYWSDALKEIANRLPEQVRLSEMNIQNKKINLKGEIKSADSAEEKVLSEVMNSLGEGIFKEVTLVTTRKGISADKPYSFELNLAVE